MGELEREGTGVFIAVEAMEETEEPGLGLEGAESKPGCEGMSGRPASSNEGDEEKEERMRGCAVRG